jgi:hypothetical protein
MQITRTTASSTKVRTIKVRGAVRPATAVPLGRYSSGRSAARAGPLAASAIAARLLAGGIDKELLQLRILSFCLLQDRKRGVSILP